MNQQLMSEEVPNSRNKKLEDEWSGTLRANGLHLQARASLVKDVPGLAQVWNLGQAAGAGGKG